MTSARFGKARRRIEHRRNQDEDTFDPGEGTRQRLLVGKVGLCDAAAFGRPIAGTVRIADHGANGLAQFEQAVRGWRFRPDRSFL